jgi:hypothetical protein
MTEKTQNTNAERVAELIKKAAMALRSEDAMRFSQAACNAANAMCALKSEELMVYQIRS